MTEPELKHYFSKAGKAAEDKKSRPEVFKQRFAEALQNQGLAVDIIMRSDSALFAQEVAKRDAKRDINQCRVFTDVDLNKSPAQRLAESRSRAMGRITNGERLIGVESVGQRMKRLSDVNLKPDKKRQIAPPSVCTA